jgi:hypothetical protein
LNCRFCGKWSGLFDDEHQDCAVAVAKGISLDTLNPAKAEPKPVTPVSIFWAVFLALVAFCVFGTIVGLFIKGCGV